MWVLASQAEGAGRTEAWRWDSQAGAPVQKGLEVWPPCCVARIEASSALFSQVPNKAAQRTPLTVVMEGGPAVCCQDPRAELVERVAAIDVAHLEETDDSPEPTRNCVDPPPRARAASMIPGGASRHLAARPSLSARKFSLQERPAGSCLEAQAGPYATGPASHISPRAWRRPTIESHHVAISDAEVSRSEPGGARELFSCPQGRSFAVLSLPHSCLPLVYMPPELRSSLPHYMASSHPGKLCLNQLLSPVSSTIPTPSPGPGSRLFPCPPRSPPRALKINSVSSWPPSLPHIEAPTSNPTS